jgi:hypothetical protein
MLVLRIILVAAVAVVQSGCSLKNRDSGALFEGLRGKGPMVIEPQNEAVASTKFFYETWRASPSIKHLVTQRGTPAAISAEREFLQPHRLKLFYPKDGQVYLLDLHEGEWFVSGSEPIADVDMQRLRASTVTLVPQVESSFAKSEEKLAVSHTSHATEWLPVELAPKPAGRPSEELRGRLKPPSQAAVASVHRADARTLIHTVTFPGETLEVLADWYTDDISNARRIASANQMVGSHRLRVGDRIALPRTLVVNPAPLPEAFVP